MSSWWQDEFGQWLHLACGRRTIQPRVTHLICGDCSVAVPTPWGEAPKPAVHARYGGTAA